ncbi:hypothetical protein [Mucilaginibacter sp.]|uniref:hypothetical protein n=1 Tax=Mucilaginibacter sp. TaxID=1882438 RepID=UPI002604B8FC|nr:hypothetical protein [Mucilaginibacter sp.]MDB4922068.1 hypothetical protein [Mucilaginibacter sp.]
MPLYFFTQPDLLQAQAPGQQFGPIAGQEQTNYRVCSLHSFSNSANAYAITNGEVKVQPIGGDAGTLVNLILKPENIQFLSGFEIKYIIYRGILKSSIIVNSAIAPATNNALTQKIWTQQANLIKATASTSTPITGDPSSDILGYNLQTLPDTGRIDQLFNVNPNMTAANVATGDTIGTFTASGGGLEIVMDGYFLDDTLASVRKLDHVITAPNFDNSYTNKSIREQVVNYLDPCAFYGASVTGSVQVMDSTGTQNSPIKTNFFKDVLFPKFLNNGILYIDIRNENYISFVYNKDQYGYNILNFGFNSQTKTPSASYAVNTWPIFSIQTKGLFNSSSHIGSGTSFVKFQFGFSKETYEKEVVLYFPNAQNIINSNNILAFFDSTTKYNGTTPVTFSSNNDSVFFGGDCYVMLDCYPADGQSITDYYVISTLLSVSYLKKVDNNATGAGNAVFPTISAFDNLFVYRDLPLSGVIPANGLIIYKTGVTNYLTYSFDVNQNGNADIGKIVDHRKLTGIFESYIAFENSRVTLFAMLKAVNNYKGNFIEPNNIPDGEKSIASIFQFIQSRYKSQVILGKHQIEMNTFTATFLNYSQVLDKKTSVAEAFIVFGLSLTTSEYQQIVSSVSSNNLNEAFYPVFVQLGNITNTQDNNQVYFNQSQVNLRGITGSGNVINQLSSPLNINVYSVDYLFCSSAAANAEPGDVTTYDTNSFLSIDVVISDELQTALTDLGPVKQDVFNQITKLDAFKDYLKIIAAAAVTKKPVIKAHSLTFSVKALTGALGLTSPDVKGLVNGSITGSFSVTIYLDSTFLVVCSTIALVHTVMHELIHAAIAYQSVQLVGGTLDFVNLKIDKLVAQRLRASKNPHGKAFGDLFCTFGNDDGPNPPLPHDNVNERQADHNYMSLYGRPAISGACKQYEENNQIVRSDLNVLITDVFAPDPTVKVPQVITSQKIYDALAWQGIERTREWRRLAGIDSSSKQLFQLYELISSAESNGTQIVEQPSFYPAINDKEYYLPVTTPTTPIC